MAIGGGKPSQFSDAALQHRLELAGGSGPKALLKNLRVFGVACFACIGGLLYGYNQGVFSGVLTMQFVYSRLVCAGCALTVEFFWDSHGQLHH